MKGARVKAALMCVCACNGYMLLATALVTRLELASKLLS